jgi:hypothetical protein
LGGREGGRGRGWKKSGRMRNILKGIYEVQTWC